MRLQLFGTPALLVDHADGTTETLMGPGKPLLILAYLVAHPDGASRETLATLGWGEQDEQHARGSLRQALHRLRKLLGTDAIAGSETNVTLRRVIPSDWQAFRDAIATGDDATTVALYRGTFLEGIPTSDLDGLGQWDTHERLRLGALWRDAALREAERMMAAGNVDGVSALTERLTITYPDLIEAWWLRLAATDTPALAGANRTARAQLEALILEGTVRGAEATMARQLLAPVRGTVGVPPTRRPDVPVSQELPLVGRGLLLTRLINATADSSNGSPVTAVLLEGAAGLGKSRLLRELTTRCADAGLTTVTVRAHPGERHALWAFLGHLVRTVLQLPGALGVAPQHAASLLTIAPDLSDRLQVGMRPEGERPNIAHLTAAVTDLLVAAGTTQRFLLMLDDLHFADTASLEVIGNAIGRAGIDAPSLVATARPGVRAVPDHWPRWQVPPLNRDELIALWQQCLMPPVPPIAPIADATMLTTGGIPIAVVRVFQLLESSGELTRQPKCTWLARDAMALAERIGDLLLHRDPSFPTDRVAQAVLGYTAAAREPVDRAAVTAALAGHAVTAVDEALERLLVLGWIVMEDDRISISHAMMVELVERALGETAMRHWRLARAEWLTQHGHALGELQRLMAILLSEGRPDAALAAVRTWRERTRQRLRGMAEILAPEHASRMFMLRLRLALSPNGWVVPTAMATMVVAVVLAVNAWFREPVTLALLNAPILLPYYQEGDGTPARLNNNPPVFQVRDRLGRPSMRLDGAVVLFKQVSGSATLEVEESIRVQGDSIAATNLRLSKMPNVPLRDSVAAVFTVSSAESGVVVLYKPTEALTLMRGTLAGQEVGREQPTIRVAPEAVIEGEIVLGYRTPSVAATLALAESSTFGDIRSDTLTAGVLHPNASNGYFSLRVRRRAPRVPGTYWLAWMWRPETAAVWILSGTNWRCGTPVWGDGNDVMARDDLASAWGGGGVVVERRLCDGPGLPDRQSVFTPMVTIKVIVE